MVATSPQRQFDKALAPQHWRSPLHAKRDQLFRQRTNKGSSLTGNCIGKGDHVWLTIKPVCKGIHKKAHSKTTLVESLLFYLLPCPILGGFLFNCHCL